MKVLLSVCGINSNITMSYLQSIRFINSFSFYETDDTYILRWKEEQYKFIFYYLMIIVKIASVFL